MNNTFLSSSEIIALESEFSLVLISSTVNFINNVITNTDVVNQVRQESNVRRGPGISQSDIKKENLENKEKSQMKEINDKLLSVLEQISQGYVTATNKSEVDRQLRLMNGMIDVYKKKQGSTDNVGFLQKLLLTTQMQMNK